MAAGCTGGMGATLQLIGSPYTPPTLNPRRILGITHVVGIGDAVKVALVLAVRVGAGIAAEQGLWAWTVWHVCRIRSRQMGEGGGRTHGL